MAVENELLDGPEITCEEKGLYIKADSGDEMLGTLSKIEDLPLIKAFHPLEIAKTKYFMQQLQQSLVVVKTEPTSNDQVESSSNEYKQRTRRRAADIRLIYSDSENESDVSEFDPGSFSSGNKSNDSDSLTDDWTPESHTKKRKRIQKKKKSSPAVQRSRSTTKNKATLSEDTPENTVSQHSAPSNEQFVCKVCDKTFEDKKGLLKHTSKAHMSEKPFGCQFCEKFFASTSNLQKHVRIHTQEKPYSCVICDKRFADGSNMRKHMEIHGAPHVCNGCDKELQHSLGLQSDETMHDGCTARENDNTVPPRKKNKEMKTSDAEQTYECKNCGSKFTVKAVYEKHLRLHEICKNYQCIICDRCFCSANDLLRHEVNIHGEVQQVPEEVKRKNENGSEQIPSVTVSASSVGPLQNITTEPNKIIDLCSKTPAVDQNPVVYSRDDQLPITLNQMQKSEIVCTATTGQKSIVHDETEELSLSPKQMIKPDIIPLQTTDQRSVTVEKLSQMQKPEIVCTAITDQKSIVHGESEELSMPPNQVIKPDIIPLQTTDQGPVPVEKFPVSLNHVQSFEKNDMLTIHQSSAMSSRSEQFSTSSRRMQQMHLSATNQKPVVLSEGVRLLTPFNQMSNPEIMYMPPQVQRSVTLGGGVHTSNQMQNSKLIFMPPIQQQSAVLTQNIQLTTLNQVQGSQVIYMPSINQSPAVVSQNTQQSLVKQVQNHEKTYMPFSDHQSSVLLSGNGSLPISLDQLQTSERICMPATSKNQSAQIADQYSTQPSDKLEMLHSFVGVETQLTSESERMHQQPENTELITRSTNTSFGYQKTNMTDDYIDLLEKQKVTAHSLNDYHELLGSLLNGKKSALERRETNQGDNKTVNALDKPDFDAPVPGLVQNVLTNDSSQENNDYSALGITNISEEDMNSLGIFFENS